MAFFIFIFLIIAGAGIFPVYSNLDPKQLRALESLNIPISSRDPCSSPAVLCDSSTPFQRVLTLKLVNCSDDVVLSFTALRSLSTLTSLSFINCPVSVIRFPSELASNIHSFTCIHSLKKLTGVWLSRFKNLTALTIDHANVTASGPGIVFSGKKFLHSVTLSQANLSGGLPKRWHHNLTFIDLSGNHLTGKIPPSLTRLENLAHLNLSSNSITGSIPSTIGDLSSLQNLSLASNSLSGSIPESLAALPELSHLDLSFNKINGTIPNFIKDLKKLKYLNLENNNFHGVLPFNATFVKSMEVFRIGQNSNLCYNHSSFPSKLKLGIAPCDKHGLPVSPPAAKVSFEGDNLDYEDYDDGKEKKDGKGGGPSKLVLGAAIAISSIIFLIAFLILIAKCCK